MKTRAILRAGIALSVLGLAACLSSDPTVTEDDTPPFIDPVILSQSMCSGKPAAPSAAVPNADPVAADFDYGAPFVLPETVLAHFHYAISTASEDAQMWFDTGLSHMANFNHDEAIAAFRAAQQADPECAMCYWGEGLSFGSNINFPYNPDRGAAGRVATDAALTRGAGTTDRERALIQALDARYSVVDEGSTIENAEAYAEAMEHVAQQFPTDKMILSLAAEANMDTQPWDYWQSDAREGKGRTARTLEMLETALELDPSFAPAMHLYIHVTESSIDPYRAEAHADRLAAQSLGVGHLVHMPSHIYLRLGEWKKSHASNLEAIAADEAYLLAGKNSGFYGATYYPHNVHFVIASSQFAGDASTATQMADKLADLTELDPNAFNPHAEHVAASKLFTDLLFSTDEDILAAPKPAAGHLYMRTAWHYARGTVFTRQGDLEAARSEMSNLEALSNAPGLTAYSEIYGVPMTGIMEVARLTLEARALAARNDLTGAIDRLESAAAAEAQLPYFEPTWWYYPTRQTLGMYLLVDGQYDRAEREFFKTLIKAPNNAYALFGLSETYRLKGEAASSAYARTLFDAAWMGEAGATPTLTDL